MPGGRLRPRKSPNPNRGLDDLIRNVSIAYRAGKQYRNYKRHPDDIGKVQSKKTVKMPKANEMTKERYWSREDALMSKADIKKMDRLRIKKERRIYDAGEGKSKPRLKKAAQRRLDKYRRSQSGFRKMERLSRSNL